MKRKYIHAGIFLFAIFASLSLICFSISHISSKELPAPAMAPQKQQIIIDPGHGGIDGGAIGVDNVVEKDINLSISLKLKEILTEKGFEVIMTRVIDQSIHDDSANTIRKQKASDLHNRLKIADDHPNALFVSIHQNIFGQSKYHGMQMFYSPNHEGSKQLAQLIQNSVTAALQPENRREIKKAEKNLFLMYNIKQEAVLAECGFLSNPDDAVKLQTDAYQTDMAAAIARAIEEYCAEKGGTSESELLLD